jgi:hypothetical protein
VLDPFPEFPKASAVNQTKYRHGQILATQAIYIEAMRTVLRDPESGRDYPMVLQGWITRMQQCGRKVLVQTCSDGHPRSYVECCNVPLCPRCQRTRANRWVERAQDLINSGRVGKKRPKLVTIGLRHPDQETLAQAVEKVIDLRKVLMRKLQREYGATAAFSAVEMSDHGHVHLHTLVWCDRLPREVLIPWLRSRDCTIAGCPHPFDDRCDDCREARTACNHLDGERQRCNGSFIFDVREAYSPVEALKYSVKPVVSDMDHAVPPTPEQLAEAIRIVKLFLVLYRRHRVETYGEAKKVIENEGDRDEDRIATRCHCGLPLHPTAVGIRKGGRYLWRDPWTSEDAFGTGPPGPTDGAFVPAGWTPVESSRGNVPPPSRYC